MGSVEQEAEGSLDCPEPGGLQPLYAYAPDHGEATISCGIKGAPRTAIIRFEDAGKPFNPLEKEDADTSLDAEEREIGGLGILMVKRSMDHISYEYRDGKNILTIQKEL